MACARRYQDRRQRTNPPIRSQAQVGGIVAIEARSRTFAQVAAEYERVELVPAVIVDGHKVGGKKQLETPKGILKRVLIPYFGDIQSSQ